MANQPEKETHNLPGRLWEELIQRASSAALDTYDSAVEKGQTHVNASLTTRKAYDGVLAPWGL